MTRRRTSRDSDLTEAAALVRATQARIHETAAHRDTPLGLERWHAALHENDQAMRRLYPGDFWQDLNRIRTGDPVAVESAIRFLEADPLAFGTGYAKETILRRLRHVALSPKQKARLGAVILDHVDRHDRRESRGYYLLAATIDTEVLRSGLFERLRSRQSSKARRALWALEAMGVSLEPTDQAIARTVIEDLARYRDGWRSAEWIGQAVRRYQDPAWIDELVERATGRGKAAGAALLILELGQPRFTPEQREQLAAIEAAIETGERPPPYRATIDSITAER